MRRAVAVSLAVVLPLVAISLYIPWLFLRSFTTNLPAATSTLPLVAKTTAAPLPLVAKTESSLPERQNLVATVSTAGLRIRSCASIDCRTVGWLRRGDTVQVRSCQNGWAYLPRRGWSRSIYLDPDPCK